MIDDKSRLRLNQLFDKKGDKPQAPSIVTGQMDENDLHLIEIYTNTPTLPAMKISDLLMTRILGDKTGWHLSLIMGLLCKTAGDTWIQLKRLPGQAQGAHFNSTGSQTAMGGEVILLSDSGVDFGSEQMLILPAKEYRIERRGILKLGPHAHSIQLSDAIFQSSSYISCNFQRAD